MKPQIIGAPCCGNCGHSGTFDHQMVCRFNPPTAVAIVSYAEITVDDVDAPGGKRRVFKAIPQGFVSGQAPTSPTGLCAQHKFKVAIARALS